MIRRRSISFVEGNEMIAGANSRFFKGMGAERCRRERWRRVANCGGGVPILNFGVRRRTSRRISVTLSSQNLWKSKKNRQPEVWLVHRELLDPPKDRISHLMRPERAVTSWFSRASIGGSVHSVTDDHFFYRTLLSFPTKRKRPLGRAPSSFRGKNSSILFTSFHQAVFRLLHALFWKKLPPLDWWGSFGVVSVFFLTNFLLVFGVHFAFLFFVPIG